MPLLDRSARQRERPWTQPGHSGRSRWHDGRESRFDPISDLHKPLLTTRAQGVVNTGCRPARLIRRGRGLFGLVNHDAFDETDRD